MSAEKHEWLIAQGKLNPDGTPVNPAMPPPGPGDAVGKAEAAVAEQGDPAQEAQE